MFEKVENAESNAVIIEHFYWKMLCFF